MTIRQAITNAARRTSSRKRMIVLYWFTQVILAALAALPLMGIAVPMLAHTSFASELLKQFDVMFLMEMIQSNSDLTGAVFSAYPVILFLTMTGGVFLAGGAVKLIVHDATVYSPREFWSGCGEYFWRFFRLMLYSMFFYGAAISLSGSVRKAANKMWGDGIEGAPLVISGWIANGLLILLCGFVSTAMDYAKVRLVTDESRKSLRACLASIGLVVKNPRVYGAWLALAILLVLFTLIYQPVANRIPGTSMPLIVLLAIWQQLYILARVWLRFMSWGTAAEFDPVVRPKPLPPEEFVPEVAPDEETIESEDLVR